MSKRLARNLIAVLLVILYCLVLLAFGGCTTYEVQKGMADCPTCTFVKVRSTREFQTPNLHYERTGQDAVFDFSADSVTNSPSPLEAIGTVAISEMMKRYFPPTLEQP